MADTGATAPAEPALAPDTALAEVGALHAAGKYAEAEAVLRKAISHAPRNSDLLNARGVMLAAMGRYADALWCYRAAIAIQPRGPGIWTNMGNALAQLKQAQSAIRCQQRAVQLSPADATLHYNLGIALVAAGRHEEAIAAFSRALALKPDHRMARWDRARSYLHIGAYVEGWADYEVRLVTGQVPQRQLPGASWDGGAYAGGRLLLLSEQGFGDTLWAARYLAAVKARGGTLIVECQREILPLLAALGLADELVAAGDPLPPADLHCYLCSLPRFFTRDLATIPAPPYLRVSQERAAPFVPLFEPARQRLKIGIVWSGSTTFKKNHERAQPLSRFLQAFVLPGIQLYSLQKGPRAQDLAALPGRAPITDLAPLLNDFADTAAAIAQLDLVIMTDSAVAHLAGALGKPVWILLGEPAHWLWLMGRSDSPWYPSARLFRPRAEGDWNHVFDAAAAALMERLGF